MKTLNMFMRLTFFYVGVYVGYYLAEHNLEINARFAFMFGAYVILAVFFRIFEKVVE